MKNLAKERARITLQISARLMQRLQEAADLRGITLKRFLVQAALKDADRIVGRSAATRDAREEAALFIEPPDDPRPQA